MRRTLLACLLPLASALVVHDAGAVGTRTFDLATLEDLSGGDLEGTSIDSRGRVRAGFRLGALAIGDANAVWSALPMPDKSVLLGTGNGGKVIKVANGKATTLADTGQIAVTSLAAGWNGATFAGTLPEGKVFRIGADGKADEFAQLPGAEGVWALVFDKKQNALFAATGPEGKLFRIDARGDAQVYYDSDEPHLVSLAIDNDGALYAGSSGKALLYRLTGPGRASVVMDFPGDDVKALAVGADGSVFAISNEYDTPPDLPKRFGTPTTGTPVNVARPKPGKGTLTRIDPSGRPERMLYRADTHFVSLALSDDGRPYVGTGNLGRVYSVDDALTTMLVADTSERQVGAMVLSGQSRFIATSDPPVFHEVRGLGGADAVWTSKVLDAGLRAHFGKLRWHATGSVELATRSGNTETPDKTWSDWSAPLTAPGQIKSPAARFIQIRARFARDASAALSDITIPFVTDNLRPVVTHIEARPKNAPAAPRGQAIPPSGGEPPSHSSTLKITWRVSNPDADPLRYRLSYQREGQDIWRDITTPNDAITKAEYEWDTSGLAEGYYRVKVEASDEMANPPDRALSHALESGIITVDNTPPVFRELSVQGRRLRGEVVDGVGPIARIDISVDGSQEFRPLLPKDGVFDEAVEAFDVDLSPIVGPGPHVIAVRAFDSAGNFVVRSVELD